MSLASAATWAKSSLEALLGFFYPEVCQICGRQRAVADEGYLCAACAAEARTLQPPWCDVCGRVFDGAISGPFICSDCRAEPPHFDYARSALAFAGPVREAIHKYKYQRALWLEPRLAAWLAAAAAPALRAGPWDAIVPVPLHPARQREREFNQAERLARQLSRATGLPLNNSCLQRVKPTPTQTRLTRAERAANLRGAFAVASGKRLAGERLVLVDDVMTTGATLNAAAGVLRRAGAGAVCAWTVARGL